MTDSTRKAPSISVIIVNYNGKHHLVRCLPSVLADDDLGIEVIVVDNASTDGSADWIEATHPTVRVIRSRRNLGFGRANAVGVNAASAPLIAFLNSDTEVTPGWLQPLAETLERRPEVQAVCSKLLLMKQPDVVNAVGGGMTRLGLSYDRLFGFASDHPVANADQEGSTRPCLFPTAAAMLMRREDFDDLGGFDPAFFMYHEDVDLGWRIWLRGGEVHVCPQSVVLHYFGGTTGSLQPSRFRDMMGMRHNVRSLIKCYQVRRLGRALLDHTRIWLRRRAIGEMTLILGWNLLHLPGTLVQRWKVQRHRKRHDRELFESGLILLAPFPPWAPALPQRVAEHPERIRSPVLRPGAETADARLGPGWYGIETVEIAPPVSEDGTPVPAKPTLVRWTSGLATCTLHASPSAKGRLRVRLVPPEPEQAALPPPQADRAPGQSPSGTEAWIELRSSGPQAYKRLTKGPGAEWLTPEIPVVADDDGRIELSILSSTWMPGRGSPNEEGRRMGCGVAEVRFLPDQAPAPVSATPENLSIIIPTYNRKEVLCRTLSALDAQDRTGFEVIVVDDGSTDGTPHAIAEWRKGRPHPPTFDLTVLHQPNLKQGRARNHGLAHARGDLVLFLGDDIIPAPEFVREHVAGHARHNGAGDVAIIGLTAWDDATVRATPFLQFVNYYGAQFGYGHLSADQEAPFTCLYTSNVSLRRAAMGPEPFDPRFDVYGWEDVELGYRLCSEGLRIIYVPSARAVHSHPMTLRTFLKRQTQVGRALKTIVQLQPEILRMPSMGDIRRQTRLGALAPVLAVLTPALSLADRLSPRPWSSRVYGLILAIAFGRGVRQTQRADT
jgi:GT2 family glycosyltransferase